MASARARNPHRRGKTRLHVLLAMQKVVGSNPISRSQKSLELPATERALNRGLSPDLPRLRDERVWSPVVLIVERWTGRDIADVAAIGVSGRDPFLPPASAAPAEEKEGDFGPVRRPA